ncbi:NADH-quinone oxidoreductase subunit L [Frigidibacter sp. RF13]|uniref:NADH-quinone oxidoreductase subunit L n=1 Tax=Frigidibacter sp. RF13 TaxID=2997340 RepID=UPI00226E7DCC|nr:NADH-quinone oxidoreductase subunit L [Frigidibacter sp. RF13]MCY1125920.1 NADH-quinone oxidoreductase subunit L [Frigidibacter sp. RF13]
MLQFILLAPLAAAIIAGFGWRLIGEKGALVLTTGVLFVACALSWMTFLTFDGTTQHVHILNWIQSGSLDTSWSIRLDRLTAIMLVVVTSVSSLVHLYSWGYMDHDVNWHEGEVYKPRFFAYLSFFTFAMLALVTADNLVQMFFGWEGVGVASYLLIGFYYRKPSANAAAIKAFVVNRVGDFGFALGIFGLFYLVDSINMDDVFAAAPALAETQLSFLWTDWNAANLLAFLLFVGAMGKSAQLFLHTWLPDAMEGPTPVSALIHAATMVTAGVFLVCRMSPLFEYAPEAKSFVMYVGAATAFFAATVGLVQNDIKRVIAYSTCSQLGYMFVAAGAGVYGAAMFHLFTHAFFKAMLFLGAGSVIHAMHHEQDMRNYGGLRKHIPLTFWAMMIGTFAITGVGIPLTTIGFAGFLSKDAIIESAFASGNGFAFWALVIAACFTSFYSWRLIFMTFYGEARWGHGHDHGHGHDDHGHGHDDHSHGHDHQPHESPAVMTIPLGVLAVGSVLAGMVWYGSFFGDHHKVNAFFGIAAHDEAAQSEGEATDHAATTEAPAADNHATDEAAATEGAATEEAHAAAEPGHAPQGAIFMAPDNHVMDDAHHAPVWVKVSPFVAMLIGFVTAWVFYIKDATIPGRLAAQQPILYRFLLNKWYFDEIYDVLFVRSAKWLGSFLWKRGDGAVIDGTINGVAMGIVPFFTRLAGRAQSGYIFHYAFAMVLGIAGLLLWMTLSGGAH